jgi:hypothetical protein
MKRGPAPVTAVKEAAMKRKKKLLELNLRFPEPEDSVRTKSSRGVPGPLVGHRFPEPEELARAVVDRSVVVLPRAYDFTFVPGPVELQ